MPYKRATYPGPGIPVQPSPPQRRDQSSPPLDRAARLSCHAPPRTLWTAAAFVAANASAEFVEGASAAVSSRGHASSRTWRSCRSIAVRLRVCEGGALWLRLKKIRYGSKGWKTLSIQTPHPYQKCGQLHIRSFTPFTTRIAIAVAILEYTKFSDTAKYLMARCIPIICPMHPCTPLIITMLRLRDASKPGITMDEVCRNNIPKPSNEGKSCPILLTLPRS